MYERKRDESYPVLWCMDSLQERAAIIGGKCAVLLSELHNFSRSPRSYCQVSPCFFPFAMNHAVMYVGQLEA